jgi:hypothetical protein
MEHCTAGCSDLHFFRNSWDFPSSLSVLEPYIQKITKKVFTLAILAKYFCPFQKWNLLETLKMCYFHNIINPPFLNIWDQCKNPKVKIIALKQKINFLKINPFQHIQII